MNKLRNGRTSYDDPALNNLYYRPDACVPDGITKFGVHGYDNSKPAYGPAACKVGALTGTSCPRPALNDTDVDRFMAETRKNSFKTRPD